LPRGRRVLSDLCGLTVIMLTCAGCAEIVWHHPSHQDSARLDADSKLCDDIAQRAVPFAGMHWTHYQARVHDAFMLCMHQLGYRRERAATPAAPK
jgi:hypothetical protein